MKNIKSISVILALTTLLLACAKKEEQRQQQMPPAPVELNQVVQKDVYRFINSLGSISSLESVNVVPQVSGQIMEIKFKQGDFVKKGQVLAEIDKRPYEAKVKAAEATLAQAKAQLEIDKLEVARNENLAKSNYVSKQAFDSYKAKVEVDEALVEAAKADLNLAKINLDWCSVKSAIDGKVGFFNVNAGNIANANSTLITSVENLSKLYVNFFVSADRQFEIQQLMKANGGFLNVDVQYKSPEGKVYTKTAKASIVENRSRYESSTIVLRAVLDNEDGMFWPKQQVKTFLKTNFVKDAILVSDAAICVDNIGSYVYVAKKHSDILYRIEKVQIKPIQLFPDGNYLVEGLKAGDIVVANGQLRVANGALAYNATSKGDPIVNSKPITNPNEVGKFMAKAMKEQAVYMAKFTQNKKADSTPNQKSQK